MPTLSRRDLAALSAGATLAVAGARAGAESDSDIAELYTGSDATDLAELVRRGSVTPRELLDEAIRRTEAVDGKLNAITLKHYELARERAQQPFTGPFAGVPFLLKDLGAELAGTPTTGGSRSLAGVVAPTDNEIVRRMKLAGVNIFGKTNTPEFGLAFTTEPTAYGPCRNPWDLERTPAGSSGGAAAAVAAGIVPMAHGSDGGGSIRVPAAACGLFGLKPTRLKTPRGPGGALSPSAMSVNHVISRSVRDSARMLDAIAGYEPGAPFAAPGASDGFAAALESDPGRLKIALNLTVPNAKLDRDCRQAVTRVAATLEELGHDVAEAAPDLDFDAVNAAQTWLVMAEYSRGMLGLAGFLGKPVEEIGLEPLSLRFVHAGQTLSAADYIGHCQSIYAAGAAMAAFQADYDLVLQPVTVTPPPKLGVLNYRADDDYESYISRFRKYAAYTYLYNLTGQPSAAVPAGMSKGGLPLAALLSGRNGEDARVLQVARKLEIAIPWFNRRPPVRA